jgi:hypothetical protein
MANEVEILKNDVVVYEANEGADEATNCELAQKHAVAAFKVSRDLISGNGAWSPQWTNADLPYKFWVSTNKWEFRAKP